MSPRCLVSFTLVLLTACGHQRATTLPAPVGLSQAVPFRASGYMVTGELSEDLIGVAYVYANEIRVVIRGGVIPSRSNSMQRLTHLSAGLAYRTTTGGWDFRRESATLAIGHLRFRGDTLADSAIFRIDRVQGIDLRTHWLVIQQHSRVFTPETGRWHAATRPLNSAKDLFAKLSP